MQNKSVISVPIKDIIHNYPMALFYDIPRVVVYFYDIPGSEHSFTTYTSMVNHFFKSTISPWNMISFSEAKFSFMLPKISLHPIRIIHRWGSAIMVTNQNHLCAFLLIVHEREKLPHFFVYIAMISIL